MRRRAVASSFASLSPAEKLARLTRMYPADAQAIVDLIDSVWKRRLDELTIPITPLRILTRKP